MTPTTLLVVIAFCVGIASGAASVRPLLALMIGVPLILIGSHWLGRRRRSGA